MSLLGRGAPLVLELGRGAPGPTPTLSVGAVPPSEWGAGIGYQATLVFRTIRTKRHPPCAALVPLLKLTKLPHLFKNHWFLKRLC